MTILTLPFPDKLSRESSHEFNFTTVTAKFGYTYEEIAPVGLNNVFKTFQITWLNLSLSDKNTLKTALALGGSWQIFSYQPCNELTSYNVRIEKDSVSINAIGNDLFEVTAKLKQVFNGV
jgi:phage-related protein